MGSDWIGLTRDKKKWRDFVYTVMDNEPSGSIKCGGFLLLAEKLLGFREGLCSTQLA
jgi:hypothetical protein